MLAFILHQDQELKLKLLQKKLLLHINSKFDSPLFVPSLPLWILFMGENKKKAEEILAPKIFQNKNAYIKNLKNNFGTLFITGFEKSDDAIYLTTKIEFYDEQKKIQIKLHGKICFAQKLFSSKNSQTQNTEIDVPKDLFLKNFPIECKSFKVADVEMKQESFCKSWQVKKSFWLKPKS